MYFCTQPLSSAEMELKMHWSWDDVYKILRNESIMITNWKARA